jgi:hypothetical protein
MITQQDIRNLAKANATDVRAFALAAARNGHKQLAIELLRCLPRTRTGVTVNKQRIKDLANQPIIDPEETGA